MSTFPVMHKEIAEEAIACIRTVIEKRADLLPLFEPLRQACGDAICGPPMAIYHYGAVQSGFLVEAAFPVCRPVQAPGVYTRQLEAARATSLLHHGPLDSIRSSAVQLSEYARAHAGTLGGQREIYLTLDPDQPERDVTEIQFIHHEWDRLLAEGLDSTMGAAAREQVMAGIDEIRPDSSLAAYTEWIRCAMARLDSLTDDPGTKYQVMSGCAHVFPQERIDHLRAIYERRRAIDDVLQEMYADPAWYEHPVRRGNTLHVRKVPFDPKGYEEATSPAERRKAYCHCAFARPYLDDVPSEMSATLCWCGSGWYRRLWEGILAEPIRVELVGTLLQGHDQCTLKVILPLALDGEMSPGLAGCD